ncbi:MULTISPECIES: hypothetical protein [unclassified Haloferax]|uniref:hypothetical protein n=1 Tax=unclassified Haloferax TaxID=2625095 RepID=UPI0002B086E7|nr:MULTISPECIES: hypothetical protein [unclassified Haloferax]ELZ55741.1 hypothetical protein C460_14755 [Haloferax sp. ATCC BAA-646]ELZ67260.1 hypothetical protein C459_02165 [Haloferax sp. ATCC BAA-645]ELZ68352.1 hypothetical protein C458_10071 [Haloferax sp. ATCC BAA-644]
MPVSLRHRVALGCYALWLVATVLLAAHELGVIPVFPGVEPGVVTGATVFFALGVVRLLRRGSRFLVGDDAA